MTTSDRPSWTAADLPDQTGRTVLVTGANSGLGLHTSLELSRRGARVLMACRNPERAAAALARVQAEVPGAQAELIELDLSSLASVEVAAKEVASRLDRLDILVDNAGVMAVPRSLTTDGFELQLGTNHLGHFALTGRLLPLLLASPDPRVVVVSSEAHRTGKINFADLMGEQSYGRWRAYGQSKLANLLFVRELQRRAPGTPLMAVAAHPGYANTNLQSGQGNFLLEAVLKIGNKVLAQSDAAGAWPQQYAATMDDVVPGAFYGPRGFGGMKGSPTLVTPTKAAQDDAVAKRLWEVSEKLTGVSYAGLAA